MPQTTLPEILAKIVREMVMGGKSKIETANELGISYYRVKKYTKDITVIQRIPLEVERKIRAEIREGVSIRDVAKKLRVSRDSIIKYTRDIPKTTKLKQKRPPELIRQIRENVRKSGSKLGTARKMGLGYEVVKWHSKDIKTKKILSTRKINKIRRMVLDGIPKRQIAKKLRISVATVMRHTSDMPLHLYYNPPPRGGGPHLRGRTLEILKQLLKDGYLFPERGDFRNYHTLRKHIPSVCKVRMGRRTIIFLEDKSDVAAKAFLSNPKKKIMTYNEITKILKLFDTKLKIQEKTKYHHNKNPNKSSKCKYSDRNSLLKKDDSCINFNIRNYRLVG